MRYLDLSYSYLEDVHAESIHLLYNLQTLNLGNSKNVQNILTEGIGSLINLRHLDLSSSDANILPDSFTRLTNLRTVNISRGYFSVLPTNIGHLQNLSSLDISFTCITELPDSFSLLGNLTMFDFSYCNLLKALPRNFGALTQLRSLDLSDSPITELPESLSSNICKLERVHFGFRCPLPVDIKNWVLLRHLWYTGNKDVVMPRGIEKLTRLEVLWPYMVRKEDDFSINTRSYNSSSSSIHELADLNSLRKLVIENLEYVRGKIEAERAKLIDKQYIQDLSLHWKSREEEVSVINPDMVLEGLQPHPNLEILYIHGFPGLKSPKWMGSSSCLPNLVKLQLFYCSCTKLVGLGQLRCLQILTILGMNSLKCIGKEFYYHQEEEEEQDNKESEGSAIANTTTATRTLFPSLTELTMSKLKFFEVWFPPQPPDNSFPCLKKVEISWCGNLTSVPDLQLWTSSLTELTIRKCEKLETKYMRYYFNKFFPSAAIQLC